VIGVLIVASLSAFAFARYRFFAKEVLFYMLIGLLMVPQVLTLVPSFVWMKELRLLNTWGALIFPYITGGQVLAIFILRTFFASTPEALYESMRLDGANMVQEYYYLALPLSRSILGVIAIVNMLNTWNDYVWPLVVISTDRLRTLTVGLVYFQGQYATQYGPQMAGYVIGSIPLVIVFFLTMRSFISGLASGALKM
jgi:ABC-type glycerol-3-phosphate transport system permease component